MVNHHLFQRRHLALSSAGQTNVDLQRYLQKRIMKHSHKVALPQAANAERAEIEDAMHRVWATSMLLDVS
jgi:hypothetical protein